MATKTVLISLMVLLWFSVHEKTQTHDSVAALRSQEFEGVSSKPKGVDESSRALTDAPTKERLRSVTSWGYQLQGKNGNPVDLNILGKSNTDLLVIDYESGDGPFDVEQIKKLKKKNDGSRRWVVSYSSIGEAENYRYYWKKKWNLRKPSFVEKVNKNWAGNYKVKYWDKDWQAILYGTSKGEKKSYLDRIIDAGFDGIYLDIVDAFEYFSNKKNDAYQDDAAKKMASLVMSLGRYARQDRGRKDFVVIPQNAPNILEHLDESTRKTYLDAVDGIGAEDTFYFGNREMNNRPNTQEHVLKFLKQFENAGKKVLSVEYITKKTYIEKYMALAKEHGFVPYVGPRSLDSLTTQN